MENKIEKHNTTLSKNISPSTINLDNRKNLNITGINEVLSSNENSIYIKMLDTTLFISGENMHIVKLDTDNAYVTIDGIINEINFNKQNNIFKRLFK